MSRYDIGVAPANAAITDARLVLARTAEKLIFGAVEDVLDRFGYRYCRRTCGKLLLDVHTGQITHNHHEHVHAHVHINENGVR